MSDQTISIRDRLAKAARIVLLAAIAVVIGLIIIGPGHNGLQNPLSVGRVNAEGGICAAPGYLMMPVKQGQAARFCVCDTNKQVICIYEMNGEKLRLVSVRKFDKDDEIFDASMQVGKTPPEGHPEGLNRAQAGEYGEAIKAAREKADKKK